MSGTAAAGCPRAVTYEFSMLENRSVTGYGLNIGQIELVATYTENDRLEFEAKVTSNA